MAENTETAALESHVVPAHVDPIAADPAPDPEIPAPEPAASTSAPEAPRPSHSAPAPQVERQIIRKGGFIPMVLGGLVAAAAGFGVSQYLQPPAPAYDSEMLHDQILDLQSQLDVIPPAPDLSGIEDRIDQTQNALDLAFADLRERSDIAREGLDALDQRLTQVEMRGEAGAVDRAALDAYQRQLADMRTLVETQTAQLRDATTSATAQLAQAQNAAEQAQSDAEQARLRADAGAALSRVEAALAQGGGYAEALPALSALADLPEALTGPAAEGVAALSALQSDLPDAARAALSAARAAGEAGEEDTGRIGAFLRSQFSVRATQAQDGDSANAVLSRIEAATRAGDLDSALREFDALPPSAQAALADWADAARRRAAALSAAAVLSQSLTEK